MFSPVTRALRFMRAIASLGCFAFVALANPATADDRLVAARSIPPIVDWTGLYFGGHVGYGRGQAGSMFFEPGSDPAPMGASNSFGSLFAGAQIGYNYMLPSRFVLGVEADVAFPNFLANDDEVASRVTADTAVAHKLDAVGTVRARLGHAFHHWLIYATGGFAWSQARFLQWPGVMDDQDKVLRRVAGWTVGAGVEAAIAPKWTARLEYLYSRFGNADATFPSGTAYETSFDLHTFRLGLNRQFGWLDAGASPKAGKFFSKADDIGTSNGNWNIHGQFTFIGQGYPAFHSPYEGTNSLFGGNQFKNTASATAYIGFRPWEGTEIYVNPEVMQGFGLSDTLGIAGFPNGEAQKSNFPMPRLDMARLFVRQTFGLGGEQETVEDGLNHIAGKRDISRITIAVGRFATEDFFDDNTYSHDPRTSFLNWNLMCCGSYDWAMDKLSYTWGAVIELNQKHWALHAGYVLLPSVSNGNMFDTHIPERGQYLTELELRYSLLSQPGKLRLLGWINHGSMGSYADALAMPPTTPSYPDITQTQSMRTNYGFLVNVEQAITRDLGIFSRASWSPGRIQIMGWTDCDQSLSLGAVLSGNSWGRPNDKIGVAGVVEGLSQEARAYFAAGGLGILIGDGQLNYRPEKVLEAYYAYGLDKRTALTFDYQFIVNPGYNADRGPVSIYALRFHTEF